MEGRCHVDTSVEGVATAFRARKEGFRAASETPAKGDPRQAVAVLTSELPDLHPCCGTSLSLCEQHKNARFGSPADVGSDPSSFVTSCAPSAKLLASPL